MLEILKDILRKLNQIESHVNKLKDKIILEEKSDKQQSSE